MDSSTKKYNKKLNYIFGTISLFILITVIFTHCILSITWGHRLRNELQAIRKKGMPMSCTDLAGPTIPDAENGAIIYAQAFKLASTTEAKADAETTERIYDKESKLSEDDWKALQRITDRNKGIIPIIIEAQKRPECRFPVDWSKGFDAKLPHLKRLKQIQMLVIANAVVHAHDGDVDQALHEIGLAIRINKSLEDEPTIISQIARVALVQRASNGLTWALDYCNPAFEQSSELDKILSSITVADEFPKAIADERAIFFSLMQNLYKPEPDATTKRLPKPVINFGNRWTNYKLAPIRCNDQLSYIRYMDKHIRSLSVPYRIAEQRKLFPTEKDLSKLAFMSRLTMPIYEHIGAARDIPEAKLSGSRISLALRAYKHKFGSFPASLNDLESTLGWKAPKDPFSDKDFVYKPKGKGFILYSIGGDLKDSGGKRAEKLHGPGDIVWSLEP